jgi:hypothetical protein
MSQNMSLLTELGSGWSTVYKRDAPTGLQAQIKLTDYGNRFRVIA